MMNEIVDWTSTESTLFFNPHLKCDDQLKQIKSLCRSKEFPGHIWIATSGSTALKPGRKWVGLAKDALLISAQAVNEHLNSDAADVWIQCLPHFHVGGLSIYARAALSCASVIGPAKKWNPFQFVDQVKEHAGTLTALVPTQVHDLVSNGLSSPFSLRACVIGGSRLPEILYRKARALGWKLLPSYGSTECASQVATALLNAADNDVFPSLNILPHIQIETCSNDLFRIKSRALFSAYAFVENGNLTIADPKENGWFTTEDIGKVNENTIQIFGRRGSVIKISGENVNFDELEKTFEELRLAMPVNCNAALVAIPDDRLGHLIAIAASSDNEHGLSQLIDRFNRSILPYERIKKVFYLPNIPRSPLGKILRSELLLTLHTKSGKEVS